jgi:hypothetical protein
MIIYTTNILAIPLLLAVFLTDAYLLLACLRLTSAHLAGEAAQRVCQGLRAVTDPLPAAVGRLLGRGQAKTVPAWLPWLVVVSGVVIVRYVLLCLYVKFA